MLVKLLLVRIMSMDLMFGVLFKIRYTLATNFKGELN